MFLTLLLSFAAFWGMAGCSTGAAKPGSQTPLISLAMTQLPPTSLVVGTSAQVSATVANDVANAGVDWVATCASAPNCGSFSPAHTASGVTTTYTAPFAVPAHNTVSVTALSATDRSKAFATTVTITSTVTGITITQPIPAVVPTGAVITLGAAVTGDPANLGVDWTATCSTVNGPVTCSPSGLHSLAGGTIPFIVPQTIQNQSLIGTSILITAFATADHSFNTTASFTVSAPVSVNITQAPPATMLTNATATVIAVVSNDPTNSGVTWSVSCQEFTCGSITPTQTASGVAVTFTAPSLIPSPNPPPGFPVTITAYATATGNNVLSEVTVNIVAPIVVKITQGVINSTIVQNSTAPLAATVSNDTANAGVDWTVTCGSAPACGSFSSTHTASGVPSTFTAPAIPVGNTVTIIATSTADPTKTDKQIVTVTNAPPPNSLLQGRFVVFLSAKNSLNGPFVLGGVISGDGNGNITAGVFDLADGAGNTVPGSLFPVVSPSSYSLGLDGRGQIQLTLNTFALPGSGSFGVSVPGKSGVGTITLSMVFVTPQHALLSETDTFGNAVGTLDLQNAADLASFQSGATGLNGPYALRLSGTEATNPYPDYFVASAIAAQASGPSFTVTGYTTDQSANGAVTSVPFTPASQAFLNVAPDLNGQIMLSLVDLGLQTKFFLDAWLIDANHFVVTDWQDASSGSPAVLIGGYLTAQPAAPSLSGTYAFTEAGATVTALPQVAGGIFTCGSTGTLDVIPLGGTQLSNQPVTASCQINVSGRSVLTISGPGGASTAGISNFAAYPTTDQGLYLIELDGGSAGTLGPSGAGVALPQSLSAPISALAFSGNYASNFLASTALGSEIFTAQIVSDSVSSISGAADVNSFNTTSAPPAGTPSSGAALSGTFTASPDGRFPVTLTFAPAAGQPAPQITTLPTLCYIVDANSCLLLGSDPTAPGTGILLLQNTGL